MTGPASAPGRAARRRAGLARGRAARRRPCGSPPTCDCAPSGVWPHAAEADGLAIGPRHAGRTAALAAAPATRRIASTRPGRSGGPAAPPGPGTLALTRWPSRGAAVEARAWGPGAEWLLERVPAAARRGRRLVGPRPLGRPAAGRGAPAPAGAAADARPGWCSTRWCRPSWSSGSPAARRGGPGAAAAPVRRARARPRCPTLRVPPDAAHPADMPTWDWHRLGVDLQRHRRSGRRRRSPPGWRSARR